MPSGFRDFWSEETCKHEGRLFLTGGWEFCEISALSLGFEKRDVLNVFVTTCGLFGDEEVDDIGNPAA